MTFKRPIKVALIGLGNSGWFYHAEGTLAASPDYQITVVCSATWERAQAAAARFGGRPHTHWERAVTDEEVDLVVIATPHHLHAPIAIAASEAGKHVVVEKPMASTVAETEQMLAAAKRADRLLTVFHNRRWEPSFTLIRDIVQEGGLGTIWRSEERRMHRGPYTVAAPDRPHAGNSLAQWAHTDAGGGGVTRLIGPHLIDHQLVLHGRPPRTVSAIMHTFDGDDVEHYCDLRLDFDHGVTSRIEIFRENVVDLPKWGVMGDAGTIICPDFQTLQIFGADGREKKKYEGLAPLQACDPFYAELAAAIHGEGLVPVDPQQAADVVAVIDAAHRSAREGGCLVAVR
jgi:scyllo-inositol 2-dehydrogenase (NADP+)